MKNYIKPGNILTYTAPAGGVVSGVGYAIGAVLVIAQTTAAAGAKFEGLSEGVVKMSKPVGDVMAEGVKVNFNDTSKEVQLAAGDLAAVAIVEGAAGNGVTEVLVKISN